MIYRDSLTITCLWHASLVASALGLVQFVGELLALVGGTT
jgi:hypothetical protein